MKQERIVAREMKCLSNMIKRKIDLSNAPGIHELSRQQGRIIGYIVDNSKENDVYQKDIEKEFDLRRSSATQILTILESKGYLVKEPVKTDARLKKLVLTEKAKATDIKMRAFLTEFDEQIQAGISDEELDIFFTVIDKVKNNIKNLSL